MTWTHTTALVRLLPLALYIHHSEKNVLWAEIAVLLFVFLLSFLTHTHIHIYAVRTNKATQSSIRSICATGGGLWHSCEFAVRRQKAKWMLIKQAKCEWDKRAAVDRCSTLRHLMTSLANFSHQTPKRSPCTEPNDFLFCCCFFFK